MQGVFLGGGGLLGNQGHPAGVSGIISGTVQYNCTINDVINEV